MGVTSSVDCRPGWGCCTDAPEQTKLECVAEGPDADRVVVSWTSINSHASHVRSEAKAEYRIRFYNFNMGNSSEFRSLDELQGPGGRGDFASFTDGLADGSACDVSFATFVETRLNFTEWVQQYRARSASKLDSLLAQSARRECFKSNTNVMLSFVEGLAASYNGNLKSLHAFASKVLEEDREAGLFGRLVERRVAGLAVPNPKKAFIGRTLTPKAPEGVRLCLVGAHFPISQVAAALEDPEKDHLEGAKRAMASVLRSVLRKANQRNLTDDRTIIFVQGDINSRTVLRGPEVKDALQEVLNDDSFQHAIQKDLDLPPGRWREVVPHESAHDLPVTYKFRDKTACQTGNSPSPKGKGASGGSEHYLTIGDVISKARLRSASAPDLRKAPTSGRRPKETENFYKRTLQTLGQEWLDRWGVAFKHNDFRSFRFPAAADRVICWASDELFDHLSLELPRGGYEVNHSQLGSDHRPVSLEVILRLWPEKVNFTPPLKPARTFTEGALSEPEDPMSEAEEDDDLDSCEGSPRTVASSLPAFAQIHSLSRRQLSDFGAYT
ncbi:unnamed protein product [Durusdinium trenchii]|uniref:Endonuclease/exonuclease/phosphatase domain-containing protein n=2 Tax=Durusdinium trenchii TaxID=1381693 RepID=A0ABP0QBL5_9DINO